MPDYAAVVVDADYVLAFERNGYPVRIEDLLIGLRGEFGRASRVAVFLSTRIPDASRARVERANLAVSDQPVHVERSVDVALAVYAMHELPKVKQLVLVSGDGDFVPLLQSAQAAGVRAVVVSPATSTHSALALTADQLLEPMELMPGVLGLITTEDGIAITRAISHRFRGARRRVVVIDSWVSEATIRLMAWAPAGTELVLVAGRLNKASLDEAADVIAGGRSLRIYTDATVHDRWFVVDDQWWHSGGSLKDLGRKVTRISEVDEWEIEKHELLLASLATPANLVVIPRKQAP
jgi:hypothetical protein